MRPPVCLLILCVLLCLIPGAFSVAPHAKPGTYRTHIGRDLLYLWPTTENTLHRGFLRFSTLEMISHNPATGFGVFHYDTPAAPLDASPKATDPSKPGNRPPGSDKVAPGIVKVCRPSPKIQLQMTGIWFNERGALRQPADGEDWHGNGTFVGTDADGVACYGNWENNAPGTRTRLLLPPHFPSLFFRFSFRVKITFVLI